MKKSVLILSVAGGLVGITGNFIFYIFGSITTGIQNAIFKSFIPGLDLSTADAAIQRILSINALTSSFLCLIAAIAGFFYFRGYNNDCERIPWKYISTVILVAASAGLVITLSFISLVLILIAAIVASISVRNDFKNQLISEPDTIKKIMIITGLLSSVILVMIYFIPRILI